MKAYTIKEVSKTINVPPGTIRQWEKDLEGLLIIPRTRQGARFYTDTEIELLLKVKEMRSKNLGKDMIRELLQKHKELEPEESTKTAESILPAVKEEQVPEKQASDFDVEGFFNALETYKQGLIQEVRAEIRNELRTEIVDELKKDNANNSLQTIKALSLSIQRSKERMKAEVNDLSENVALSSEIASESLENLSDLSKNTAEKISNLSEDMTKLSKGTSKELAHLSTNVTKITNGTKKDLHVIKENVMKFSKGTSKEISSISNNIAKFSKGTNEEIRSLANRLDESSEDFKVLTDYLAKNRETTTSELNTLNEQLAMDREYYLETLKLEREKFQGEIEKRDAVFKEMVVSFRDAAATKEPTKKWWQLWK